MEIREGLSVDDGNVGEEVFGAAVVESPRDENASRECGLVVGRVIDDEVVDLGEASGGHGESVAAESHIPSVRYVPFASLAQWASTA